MSNIYSEDKFKRASKFLNNPKVLSTLTSSLRPLLIFPEKKVGKYVGVTTLIPHILGSFDFHYK